MFRGTEWGAVSCSSCGCGACGRREMYPEEVSRIGSKEWTRIAKARVEGMGQSVGGFGSQSERDTQVGFRVVLVVWVGFRKTSLRLVLCGACCRGVKLNKSSQWQQLRDSVLNQLFKSIFHLFNQEWRNN